MSLTNFPNGISSFGVPVIGGSTQIPVTTGAYFFVSSDTGSDSNDGKSAVKPFSTIDKALSMCTADKGDVVLCMPGHTETISTAGGLAVDVAGVSVIGLGNGALRPTLTLSAAAATVTITAANTLFKNFILVANFADIVVAIVTSAKNITIEGCDFTEAGADLNFLSCIATNAVDNASDGLAILSNRRLSIDAAALAFVSVLANTTGLKIIGNYDNQSSAANVGHFLIMAAKVVLGLECNYNVLNLNGDNNAQTVGVFATGSSTTSTGIMAYNLVNSLDATTELFDTATLDFGHFENRMTGTIAKSGYVLPAIDS